MRYSTVSEVIEACYQHLESNLQEGERWGLKYRFYKPAQTKYGPHQWLWDSGWHQIVWSHRNVEYSIADLRTLLQFQQPNGFIPEMIFWGYKKGLESVLEKVAGYSKKILKNEKTGKIYKGVFWTDISQMPMLAYSLRAIWEATNDEKLLKEFVPKLVRYQEWWHKERDPDKDGLISIIHPWESGLDASPIYDPVFDFFEYPVPEKKYYAHFIKLLLLYRWKARWNIQKILKRGWFNVEDIGVCSVYTDAWSVLAKLAEHFDTTLASMCRDFNKQYSDKLVEKAWDEKREQFVSFYHTKGVEKVSTPETIQSLFPLLLDNLPKDILEKLVEKVRDPNKFGLPYPVPTTAKSDPAFNPLDSRLMWRGPSWGGTTWLILEGLIKHNYMDVANHILDKWLEMYKKFGISEYHNPLTGEIEGQEGLGMATTIVNMLYRLKRI